MSHNGKAAESGIFEMSALNPENCAVCGQPVPDLAPLKAGRPDRAGLHGRG